MAGENDSASAKARRFAVRNASFGSSSVATLPKGERRSFQRCAASSQRAYRLLVRFAQCTAAGVVGRQLAAQDRGHLRDQRGFARFTGFAQRTHAGGSFQAGPERGSLRAVRRNQATADTATSGR